MSKLNPISEEIKKERKDKLLKELKNMILPIILLAIFAGLVIFVMNYQKKAQEPDVIEANAYDGDGSVITIENESLKMDFDPTTLNFDLKVKSSGKVWHSVPEGAADDSKAISEEKNKIQSSLLLTYSNDAGLDVTLNSHSFSAENGIYSIESGEDYVKVNYSLGKVSKEYIYPTIIKEADFMALLDNLPTNKRDTTKQLFKKYDINKLGKKDNKEELLAEYPILETEVCYILRNQDELTDSNKKTLQATFELAGYTYEAYKADKELSFHEASDSNPVFNVTVIYRLDGDDLVVEAPISELEGPKEYYIYALRILPYFGAGGVNDEGYLLVPEGGGSIINFNNGKTSQSIYYSNVYGWDMALERKDLVHSTHANMDVFGLSSGDDSYICILEDGASYASVTADISGRVTSFNSVCAEFNIKPREQFDMGGGANQTVYAYLEELPDENIVQRYSFIDSGSYVDMAKDYQSYLKNKYPESFTKNDETTVPVAVEVVGAVDKVKQIMGIPVSRPLPLTTMSEAEELLTQMVNDGFTNLSAKYVGWANGGVTQKIGTKYKPVASLGNEKDLKNLISTAEGLGVDFYLDGVTDYAYNSNIFRGFFSYTDAAKFLSRKRAELYLYSDVTFTARDGWKHYFLLHGDKIIEMAGNLNDYTDKVGANVAFRDMGKDLSSDYYKKDYTSREEQRSMQNELLKETDATGKKIMINSGNAYAMPYADFITNMDLKGSEYTIIDETVPFYQIAIHGYVDYSGYPVNICGNSLEELLTSAEYGAGLSFTLMKESSFTLQKTLYPEFYASDVDKCYENMLEMYTRYNKELGHTFNQEIIGHTVINEDVKVTEYEDGTKVYVNYGFNQFETDGVVVPARDYLVIK